MICAAESAPGENTERRSRRDRSDLLVLSQLDANAGTRAKRSRIRTSSLFILNSFTDITSVIIISSRMKEW